MTTTLQTLTRKQKLDLLDAIEEKKRRKQESRTLFVPNKGQAPVFESFVDTKIETILVLTGNGGGKSAMGANLAIDSANGYVSHTKTHMSVPARIYVILDKPEKVTDVWLPEIKKWYPLKDEQLHKRGKPYVSNITFDNGSEIIFMFHEQSLMSFESVEGDVFIFDEPCPRAIFIALRRAGRKKGRKPKYLIIGTPIAASWLRKELYEPWVRGERPEIACFRFSTDVNKVNLSDGYLENFSRYLSEKEQQIRIHGQFFDLEGLALAHIFDRDKHLLPMDHYFNPSFPCIVALDPHPRKAHTAILLGISPDDRLFVLKEFSSRAVPSQFARELRNWYQGYKVIDIVCDSLGSSELTGGSGNLSFIQVLKDNGVRVRPTTFDEKKDEAWISNIQEALTIPLEPDNFGNFEPRLKIDPRCKWLINDIETVEWAKYRNIDEFKPKLAIESKDQLAALKYALAAEPRFTKGREPIIRSKAVGWSNKEKWRR